MIYIFKVEGDEVTIRGARKHSERPVMLDRYKVFSESYYDEGIACLTGRIPEKFKHLVGKKMFSCTFTREEARIAARHLIDCQVSQGYENAPVWS